MGHLNIEKLQKLYDSNISKPGLLRIIELVKRLGNPQNELKCVHVAGTNGKGSTCAYIESVMRSAGYKTAVFSSPHIYELREHIKINNELISIEDFDLYLEKTFTICEEMVSDGFDYPSYFEIITATAFNYFCDKEVDIALIETGMGGKLDATNVILPILSIITSISFDHVEFLGKSLKSIAKHKAGIIKVNTPLVLAPRQKNKVVFVIKSYCRKMNSTFYNSNKYKIKSYKSSLDGQSFSIKTKQDFFRINIRGAGRHQIDNVVAALCALNVLKELDYNIKYSNIKNGLSSVLLDSRIEHLRDKRMIIDGSHNIEGVRELRLAIKKNIPNKKIVLVCSVSATKDAKTMVKEYSKFADIIIVAQSKHPLSMKAPDLSSVFESNKTIHEIYMDIKSAIEAAVSYNIDDDTYIVISGSFYMISEVKEAIDKVY